MLLVGLGTSLALVVIAAAGLLLRARAQRRALARLVAEQIEPYLRRKAAEAGLPSAAPVWTGRAHPDEVVAYSADLAAVLLTRERAGPEPEPESLRDTDPALARTVPLAPVEAQGATTAKARRRPQAGGA